MKKMNRRSFFGALSAAVVSVSLAAAIPAKANNIMNKEINIQELFDNGFEPVMGYTFEQHLDLIEKIKNNNIMQNTWNQKQIDNVSHYFVNIPDTASMKMWNVLSVSDVRNTIAVHQYWNDTDNTSVSRHLRGIMEDKQRYAIVARNLNYPPLKI
jgi:hypothetical protein